MTHQELINASAAYVASQRPAPWAVSHCKALERPRDVERALLAIIHGLAQYADDYVELYHQRITSHPMAMNGWHKTIIALKVMLLGGTGRLDPGTLSVLLHKILKLEGLPVN